MKITRTLLALLIATGILGCGSQPELRYIVILPDVSGSIEREGLDQAFKAIDELVSQLNRGDKIVIIPILGNAQAEASGRIIRFDVPINRQAYDSDLRNFRATLKKSLEGMKAVAAAHPGSKTDILGSVGLAQRELKSCSIESKKSLAILSDFIQEDGEVDFRTDKRLTNKTAARKFAVQLTSSWSLDFTGMHIFLGSLRSKEYASLGQKRMQAIQGFWTAIFDISGAKTDFAVDGPGLLKKII